MSICRTSPFSSRTKSLREKFASKRSYSESFKDPPASASGATSTAAGAQGPPGPASGLPSSPCVGLGSQSGGSSTDSTSGLVMAPSLQEYLPAYTAENAYCSALDINSQQGDPRFPWQRDAAVQCDLKSLALSASLANASAVIPPTRSSSSDGRPGSVRKPTTFAAASRGGDFNSGTWSDPPTSAASGTSWAPTPPPRRSATSSATPVLQRALSLERSAARKKTSSLFSAAGLPASQLPASLQEEGRAAAAAAGGVYVPHHVQTLSKSPEGGSSPTSRASSQGATAAASRSSSSPSETTPPQTRRPSAAERRKMCFVRKETNSAPNSMDEDVPSPSSSISAASTASSFASGTGSVASRTSLASTASAAAVANAAPERPGYFNFESMQRLLDLSMNVPADRKSFFLEIPSQEGESFHSRS
ncbi:unnamed protein product, partial [Ixodes hexagonus]